MAFYLMIPFAVHAAVMFVDEFHYHYERGLPRWERVGHPLDTLTILACFFWVLAKPVDSVNWKVYAVLAAVSCIFVTKDEWIHAEYCKGGEQWLHSLLFLFHPIVLLTTAVIWPFLHGQALTWLILKEGQRHALKLAFTSFVAAATLYFFYQIFYWNLLWKKSTTPATTR